MVRSFASFEITASVKRSRYDGRIDVPVNRPCWRAGRACCYWVRSRSLIKE